MQACPEITINLTVLTLAMILGHCLAWIFNWLVNKLDEYQEGYTWLLVVIGVGFTLLLALAVIPWQYLAILLGFFAATGIPMAIGDIWRTKSREVRARQEIRAEALRMAREVLDAQKR